jgi:hypothetical protein
VRHKILDVIGDLYLLGYPIRGRVTARLTGHRDNIALLRAIRRRHEHAVGLDHLRHLRAHAVARDLERVAEHRRCFGRRVLDPHDQTPLVKVLPPFVARPYLVAHLE